MARRAPGVAAQPLAPQPIGRGRRRVPSTSPAVLPPGARSLPRSLSRRCCWGCRRVSVHRLGKAGLRPRAAGRGGAGGSRGLAAAGRRARGGRGLQGPGPRRGAGGRRLCRGAEGQRFLESSKPERGGTPHTPQWIGSRASASVSVRMRAGPVWLREGCSTLRT